MKAIHDISIHITQVLPGHYFSSKTRKMQKWYSPAWHDIERLPTMELDLSMIRCRLTESVKSMMMADVPFGVLISGGVDSSIIAAIAVRHYKEIAQKSDLCQKLHSFCIGLETSPDLKQSRKVADYLGTEHHELIFTLEEGLDAIEEVIYHTETFNPTTIRASTPMYLMARKIRSLGIKMVLTGEGADEMFGGYLYFHKAPNPKEFHQELVRKMQNLYFYDLLRADKSTLAFGVEARVPFLEKSFIEYVLDIDAKYKMVNPEN